MYEMTNEIILERNMRELCFVRLRLNIKRQIHFYALLCE